EPGRGVATILEMVNHTRLDCVIGSAGMMRAALAQALHHARHRTAFGKLLVDQPLMRNVLADLALESEAATATMLRLARAYGADRRLDVAVDHALGALTAAEEAQARRVVEALALALQASLLVRHAPPAVADAFCASRLAGDHGYALGTLPAAADVTSILE